MAAKGSKAWAICDRCGLRSKYLDMVVEPGTGLFVDKLCNDGQWNRVDHPQNFSPKPRLEGQGLKNASPDAVVVAGNHLSNEEDALILGSDSQPIFI
jgi:hypothetical protein